jgi:hypothetical protein
MTLDDAGVDITALILRRWRFAVGWRPIRAVRRCVSRLVQGLAIVINPRHARPPDVLCNLTGLRLTTVSRYAARRLERHGANVRPMAGVSD